MIHAFLRRYQNGYWRRCTHRSHRLGLICWRGFTYDGFCSKHNGSCFNDGCPTPATRLYGEPR
jgi:hypothetical protein